MKARKSKRAQALNGSYNREICKPGNSSKFSTGYEASKGSHNRDGFKSNGNSSRSSSSSDGNNCDVSKSNGNSSRSSSSYDGSRGTGGAGRIGRRKPDDSGNGEMEVITLEDSSDGEMVDDLEEEAELIRLIQRRISMK